ncbi:MAG: glycosyltransferase family 39 protein [Crocinitomicaceae bacterium]|nr:glycosyltransferase family 39 protein [Crocinitomicaceae bacterium]
MKSLLQLLKKDFSAQATFFCLFVLFTFPFVFGFPLGFLGWDTFGYYLYLPQFFIEGDIALTNLTPVHEAIENYNACDVLYQAHPVENGNHVIQYSSGMALVFTPFFLFGHFFAWIFDYPMDGYSLPYVWSLIIGGYIYTIIGLIFTRKVLLKFFSEKITGWTIILLVFGSNYLNIQTLSIGMPHIYLFAFYAALIYYTIQWHEHQRKKHAIIIGALLGCMVLIRPTEIFAAFIPLLWGIHSKESLRIKWEIIKSNWKPIALLICTAFIFISVQLVYWKYTTDSWVYYSYKNPGEGFDLDNPHLLEFLFSYRKGWLLYTPIMLIPFIGLLVKHPSKRHWITPFIVFAVITIYVSSSWTTWWYATSFSQRTMVQSYPLFALGLATCLSAIWQYKKIKYTGLALLGAIVILNVFQSWQYMTGVLPPDRITKAYYWEVFGKTKVPPGAGELLSLDRSTAVFNPDLYELYWSRTIEEEHGTLPDSLALSENDEWGLGIKVPFEETSNKDYCWYKIELDVKIPEYTDPSRVDVIAHLTYIDKPYAYTAFPLNKNKKITPNEWTHLTFYYISPHIRTRQDRLITFVWGHQQDLLYKNFKVSSYVEKE